MALGEYLGAGSGTTKGLYHLNGNSNDSSGNGKNGTDIGVSYGLGSGILGQGASVNTTSGSPGISIPANTLGTIGTGDFTVSFMFFGNAPAAGKYPIIFGSFYDSPPFIGPTIFFDPLSVNALGNGIIFRITKSNEQIVTTPSASSLYGKRTHIVFTRISGICYVYYNSYLVKQFNDNTNISAAGTCVLFGYNGVSQIPSTTTCFDEYILENVGWTQNKVQKYYTYSKGRFGIT